MPQVEICVLHTLIQILEETLRVEGIENLAGMARRKKSLERVQVMAAAAGRKRPHGVVALRHLTRASVKLLRWLSDPAFSINLPGMPPRPGSASSTPLYEQQCSTPFIYIVCARSHFNFKIGTVRLEQ